MTSFVLTPELLAEHRAGQLLALGRVGVGRSYRTAATRPNGYELRSAIGASLYAAAMPPPDGDEMPPPSEEPKSSEDTGEEDGSAVALLTIHGPLEQRSSGWLCGWGEGYDTITERLQMALEDRRVGAVVLAFDSPGGDAAGLDESTQRMRSIAQASGKAVLAYVDEQAASAAYWMAATVASAIYVPRNGEVGCIGTLAVHRSQAGALEKAGVEVTLISDPPGKTAGNPYESLSKQGRARLERSIKASTERFYQVLGEARGLDAKDLAALDGDMLAGQAAVDAGLADAVGSLDDVLAIAGAHAETFRASRAAAPPPDPSKAPPAPPAPAPGANAMRLPSLRSAAGIAPEISDARLEAELVPVVTFASRMRELAGAPDLATAEGTIRAAMKNAARVAELEKAAGERTAKDEAVERVAIVRGLVTSHRITPAEAWATNAEGAPDPAAGVAAEWGAPSADGKTGMSLEVLRATASRLQPLAIARPAEASKETPKDVGAGGDDEKTTAALLATLTNEEKARCAATGRDPVGYAHVKATMNRGGKAA